jgi:hypothetical protein
MMRLGVGFVQESFQKIIDSQSHPSGRSLSGEKPTPWMARRGRWYRLEWVEIAFTRFGEWLC